MRSFIDKVRTAAQAALALSYLLSTPVQAQDLVGTWSEPRLRITFQSDGRWSVIVTDPSLIAECGGPAIAGGPYTGSAGSISMSADNVSCGNRSTVAAPQFFAGGSYSISGSTLSARLKNAFDSLDVTLSAVGGTAGGSTTIAPSTPLPPPPVVQSVYVAPSGRIPEAAVAVTAVGTFGSATVKVTLDIVKVLQSAFAASPAYNIYVVAMVPGALLGSASPVFFVKPKAPGNWGLLRSPIAAFLEDVAQSAVNDQVTIEILSNTDISSLLGTEIYIGYGTSDTEMLDARRYRGVYKVQ